MRLQTRLFLLFSCLLMLMLAGALAGLRLLTRDLSAALDAAAFSVGSAMVSVLDRQIEGDIDVAAGSATATRQFEHRVLVRAIRPETDSRSPPAAKPEPDASTPVPQGDMPLAQAVIDEPTDGMTETRFLRLELGQHQGDLTLTTNGIRQVIRVPRSGISDSIERFSQQLMFGALLLLALGMLSAYVLARRIARPLRELAAAAGEIGTGAFGQTVAVSGVAELRTTIETFNRMSAQLADLDAERERLRALANLSELGEVGRGLAHSLRNPLNTLGLAVDTLAQEDNPAIIADLRNRAREQIRRIDEALKGFLALGAGLAGVSENVDIRELVEDLLLEASQRADGRVSFALKLPAHPLLLKVQAQELRAALQALLVNALEASPDGGEVHIELREVAPERAQLEISDRGPGLPARVRERLFTPHLSTKPEGAGMGLFLAQRILRERYDGQLELNDRNGGGTVAQARFGARHDG